MITFSLKKDWKNFQLYTDQIKEIENCSFPVPWSTKAFEEEIKKSISNFWAVISDKKILAYICFWMFDKEIHILNFAVHPNKRNRGLGKFLLKAVIEAGNSKGVENIWLEVRPSNIAALSIYNKFGFVEAGRRTGYYADSREDAIVMTLDLTGKPIDTLLNC